MNEFLTCFNMTLYNKNLQFLLLLIQLKWKKKYFKPIFIRVKSLSVEDIEPPPFFRPKFTVKH
jgi:hypothetical protein